MVPAEALARSHPLMLHPPGSAIDIIVPVYNAADDLKRCVDSVLLHTGGDYRLLLIDDASTDPAVGAYLEATQSRALPQVHCVSNESNLGFTLTANLGMSLARDDADVVLLNSDTIVTRGWLDKLARCAQSDPRIGTITPFSNNAEICSLPRFCENNPWPPGRDTEPMVRALEQAAVPSYPELPTGVGFCLYIRRELIDAIGVFDPVFGLGYGEENDFCLRAARAGFRNVLCDDAFVVHLGGSSFGAKRNDLARRNMAILLERHPQYLDRVEAYIAADPLRPLRELALAHYRMITDPLPGLLHVIHDHGGGAEYYARALIAASSSAFHHYLLIAIGDEWQLQEHVGGEFRSYDFRRLPGEQWGEFLAGLCARFGIELIHLHVISGCRDGLISALAESEVPYGYTVHDLNFACPTINFLNAEQTYCGGVTDAAVCAACLAAQPAFAGIDIAAWRSKHRALLARAAFVIAPSSWAASMVRRYFPEHEVHVIPHGSSNGISRADAIRTPLPFHDDGRPVVAVLGAIGPDKGARRLQKLVEFTQRRDLALRWVLIGYLDRVREPWQSSDGVFTMHGPYASDALPELLEHYCVRLVAFPSVGPESFSFTLSEAWAAGLPAVVPPIGALVDRVSASGAGWVLTEEEWRSDERMLDRIVALLDPMAKDAYDRAAACARAAPQHALTDDTLAVYRGVEQRTPSRPDATPIAAGRCLAALSYAPWCPPAAPVSAPEMVAPTVPRGPVSGIARFALRIRHTLPGRVLYRLAPEALREALKARIAG
jgi:GT2 family glycosyltransferase/glycosyltransferase involved in cell wall biosynthesis